MYFYRSKIETAPPCRIVLFFFNTVCSVLILIITVLFPLPAGGPSKQDDASWLADFCINK